MSEFSWAPGDIIRAIKRRSIPAINVVEPWVDDIISMGVILSSFTTDTKLYLHDGQYYIGKTYLENGSYQMFVEDQAGIAIFMVDIGKETNVSMYSSGPWEILLVKYEKLVRFCKSKGQDPFLQDMGIGIVRKITI